MDGRDAVTTHRSFLHHNHLNCLHTMVPDTATVAFDVRLWTYPHRVSSRTLSYPMVRMRVYAAQFCRLAETRAFSLARCARIFSFRFAFLGTLTLLLFALLQPFNAPDTPPTPFSDIPASNGIITFGFVTVSCEPVAGRVCALQHALAFPRMTCGRTRRHRFATPGLQHWAGGTARRRQLFPDNTH